MSTSQNGYPVLTQSQTKRWDVPGTGRGFTLAPGNPGFVLCWLALWLDGEIERIDRGEWDEWGWADRSIRGSTTISNHASGTAIDVNAVHHPMGVRNTFTLTQRVRIRWCLRIRLRGAVRWGGDYSGRPDDMHFEINVSRERLDRVADRLRKTRRGKRVVRANRGA